MSYPTKAGYYYYDDTIANYYPQPRPKDFPDDCKLYDVSFMGTEYVTIMEDTDEDSWGDLIKEHD